MYNTPPATPFEQPKKSNNRNIIIAVVVVLVLCCCCCLIGFGVRAYAQSQVGGIFSSINQGLSMTPGAGGSSNPLGNPAVATAEAMATNVAKGTLIPDGMPALPTSVNGAGGSPTEAVPGNLNSAIPQGGLGDDVLRADAWGYVLAASAIKGCNASDATKTTISVFQKPASSTSSWVEKWTVTCMDGSNATFVVTFTPSKGGGTDVSVTAGQ